VGKKRAVYKYIGRGVGTVDLQIIFVSGRQLGFGQFSGIAALSPEVVSTAVLTVNSIPGMGQVYHFPIGAEGIGSLGAILLECPRGI
jgi:hypothetical protein